MVRPRVAAAARSVTRCPPPGFGQHGRTATTLAAICYCRFAVAVVYSSRSPPEQAAEIVPLDHDAELGS